MKRRVPIPGKRPPLPAPRRISFHLPDRKPPLGAADPQWDKPLPTRPRSTPTPVPTDTPALSYGEYFSVITRFLARNDYRQLRRALEALRPRAALPEKWELKVVSEKHGAFYHPARIQVSFGRRTVDLVVNLALSDAGRRALPREAENLLRLELEFGLPYLPRVFGSGELEVKAGVSVSLFLGEWFRGHYEFHLAPHPLHGRLGVHLWDPRSRDRFLNPLEIDQLFFQAALILTVYYNPLTTEQIFPWHHGAGDFLYDPRAPSGDPSVRLISVRGYQPLIHNFPDPPGAREILDALVLFFLHMCLRLRLDRFSGVGERVWIPPEVLAPALKGFLAGLEFHCTHYGLPEGFASKVGSYLKRLERRDLKGLYTELVRRVYPPGEARTWVSQGLEGHSVELARLLGR